MKIEVIENVMQYNKEEAEINRESFRKNKVTVINLLSAPGAGKTSLIISAIKKLKNKYGIAVIEGDIASTHDAEKIKSEIDSVIQINTGGTCHLNASMVSKAIEKINLSATNFLFIENVGNLICPAGFDLGEKYKIVLSSVSEGDDKPVKYPKVFINTDLVILNKIDLLQVSDFDLSFFLEKIRELNPEVPVLKLSCKTGEGISDWITWLEESFKKI